MSNRNANYFLNVADKLTYIDNLSTNTSNVKLNAQTAVENCIVIEDSTNGIKAANAAGIFCIGYESEHSKLQNLSTADKVIARFEELSYEIIRDLN
jgi:beta-phosphoglucomutase-like phosphatase (HAD superfamily)